MGLESNNKFESCINVLRQFICGCNCIRGNNTTASTTNSKHYLKGSIEEANNAIEILQEIFHIYNTTILELEKKLKQHLPEIETSNHEIVIKKEAPFDFNQEISPKEDKENDDHFYVDDFTFDPDIVVTNYYKDNDDINSKNIIHKIKKKRKKDKSKKIKKNKKHKDKENNKINKKKKLPKNNDSIKNIVIKTEEGNLENDKKIGIKTSSRKKISKDGLTKTAKAKLQLIQKRLDRDEHYKLFGKKHICAICNKNFVIKIFLEKHMLKEHGPQKKEVQWECDECGRFYASKRQLERHKMIHRGEKSFQCEICGRGFDTYDTRYIHQFVHADNKYICDYCGKVYRQRRHLVQHMKNHNGYIWKCKDCGKIFDTQRKWLYHKKNHSGTVKKKQCDICGATFAASSSIRNHMMIHLGHKPYQCSQCDMSFVQAGGLRTHEKTHNNTSRSHRCELCGKMMTSKGLAYHLMVHEGSRPYKCDKCNKAFVTDFKLRKHKKIHLRLGHYKSEEEAGILKPRRKSSTCLPKDEIQPPLVIRSENMIYPSISNTDINVSYSNANQ